MAKIALQKRLWICGADVAHELGLQMTDRSFQETPNDLEQIRTIPVIAFQL